MPSPTTDMSVLDLFAGVKRSKTQAEAEVHADRLREHTGLTLEVHPTGRTCRKMFTVRWIPTVGDQCWYGYPTWASAEHHTATVTHATTTRFTTSRGDKFYWSAKRREWNQAGTASAVGPVTASPFPRP